MLVTKWKGSIYSGLVTREDLFHMSPVHRPLCDSSCRLGERYLSSHECKWKGRAIIQQDNFGEQYQLINLRVIANRPM